MNFCELVGRHSGSCAGRRAIPRRAIDPAVGAACVFAGQTRPRCRHVETQQIGHPLDPFYDPAGLQQIKAGRQSVSLGRVVMKRSVI